MWLTLQILPDLFQAIEDLDALALVQVGGLQQPEVLLQMFRRHLFVVIVPAVYLLEFLLEFEEFWVILQGCDDVGHWERVLHSVLAVDCLLTHVLIIVL